MPVQELFHELDTDSSGTVSLDELSHGLRKQGYVLADSEVEQLVGGARLPACLPACPWSFEDWAHVAACQHVHQITECCESLECKLIPAATDPVLISQVRKIDADHDGNIVMSEFLTTLIDWNQLQKEQKWQVRGCRHSGRL